MDVRTKCNSKRGLLDFASVSDGREALSHSPGWRSSSTLTRRTPRSTRLSTISSARRWSGTSPASIFRSKWPTRRALRAGPFAHCVLPLQTPLDIKSSLLTLTAVRTPRTVLHHMSCGLQSMLVVWKKTYSRSGSGHTDVVVVAISLLLAIVIVAVAVAAEE